MMRSLRVVLLVAAAALAVFAAYRLMGPSPSVPLRRSAQKVFVLGFDGMDPTLARRFMDEGKLPNLKALAGGGGFRTLASTQPSESPVAWQTFITGVNPGQHGIYDFLKRDPATYMPDPRMGVVVEAAEFLWGLIPIRPPKVTSDRGGTPFWVTAGRHGIPSVVLTVPMTFPPIEAEHGHCLSGLPLPDIRNILGMFSYWATDLSPFEQENTEFGGHVQRLTFQEGTAETRLRGPVNPVLRQEEAALSAKKAGGSLTGAETARLADLGKGKDIHLPLRLRWTPGSGRVEIDVHGATLRLRAGEWSEWVPLAFDVTPFARINGMTQFHVIRADQELQLYASPVNFDPREPPVPISHPASFSARLAAEIGLYRTLGWAESADKALNDGRLDEAAFLNDANRAFDDREKLILQNLERDDWDLFVAALETTDRISHMMWRLIDPKHPMYDPELAARHGRAIEDVYRRADGLVGRVRQKLPAGTAVFVMSDHGFHSYRRSVNLNTWLYQNGYLAFTGETSADKTLSQVFGRGTFWEGVDWSRTRAYALGLGQIYVNLRGREAQGIVSAGAEYSALQDEIGAGLVRLRDPEDGAVVIREVYERDDMYRGEYLHLAPDLQVGFENGYRVGWQDTVGGIRKAVIENNNRKWSGDHCATAAAISGGVLFSDRRLVHDDPAIGDLAPTILKLLGVAVPGEMEGRPLL